MVILFAAFCVCRSKNNSKFAGHHLYYTPPPPPTGSALNYSYSSIYKRPGSTTKTPKRPDPDLTLPLKPDVRREHQECPSVYANKSDRSSAAGLYDTPDRYFAPLYDNNNNNNKNSTHSTNFYNNTIESASFFQEEDDADQSYDKNPVESSLLSHDTDSSRSFEENIEEYKEPKFVDLRKPPYTRSRHQLNSEK
jgi:hypothetical protein